MAKRVPSLRTRKRREVTLPSINLVEFECAFCRGEGRDPFGIMSELSACCVCSGKGTVRVAEPYAACRFCNVTGVEPFTRLTCLACRGKGAITVAQPMETCAVCNGTGRQYPRNWHFYCLCCHGAGVAPVHK